MLSLSLFRSLRDCLVGSRSVGRKHRCHKPSRGFTPCLETLEDRCLLAVTPLGTEALVNQTIPGIQGSASTSTGKDQTYVVAADAQGNFVVAWTDANSNPVQVRARLFFADGTARTDEFVVGTTPAGDFVSGAQNTPVVAMEDNGDFAIAWDNTSGTVSARRYDAAGTALGSTFQVTTISQTSVNGIAMDATGDFVVVYQGPGNRFGSAPNRYFQRYNAAGQAQGNRTRFATPQLINGTASVAMDGQGNFAIAWDDTSSTAGIEVSVQRYDTRGRSVGSVINASGNAAGIDWLPSIAMNDAGKFTVTWSHRPPTFPTDPGFKVGQVFNANGSFSGSSFVFDGGPENRVGVGMDAGGNVVLGWQADDDIQAVRYSSTGTLLDSTFTVNTTLAGTQAQPGVAVTESGKVVITWAGNGVGDVAGMFAQRYLEGSPLRASAAPATSSAQVLSQAALQPLVQEAIVRWQATGLTATQMQLLQSVSFQIADLGGTTLGLASGTTIRLDDNAAGWGWFIDATPADDSEFRKPGDQGEQHYMDLLTVVMHEMGHVLGLDHDAKGVMQETLAPGTRLSPSLLDLHFAGVEEMADVALALSTRQR